MRGVRQLEVSESRGRGIVALLCWCWVWFGLLRVVEGLCSQEGSRLETEAYLFSLSGSVLVLSLVKIGAC